ncbi:hypothetical protein EGM88_05090 [Aureibaculum marinum]|uniref:Uncharacterized protein n=1 Tax=Aureibaculum marinum TaxID=2487930 RepID=A0A3N4P1X3_9FLAO|nr:hypothetical protein [Aureibaculum marinum]RPD98570.1 hypothetical protein EGM88_05090 [Aureibaculum marinum]
MDLKDFIKNTISSISEAIIESQTELKDKGVIVNPEKTEIGKTGEKLLRSDGSRYVQNVDFDVLVAVEDKQEDDLEGRLKIAGLLNIGGGISDENISKNYNKIKFTIPIAFSTTSTPDKYKPKRTRVIRE